MNTTNPKTFVPSLWKSEGTLAPSSNGSGMDRAAHAGDSRVYYTHKVTGEHCWRHAGWGTGTGFTDHGQGHGCDADGRGNGKVYDEAEFEGTWV